MLESYDRRHRFAIYSLRVVNDSTAPLFARFWIISQDGTASPGHPVTIEIAPFSRRATDVPVWVDDCKSFSRALAEIAGDGIECVVEAAAPPLERQPALTTTLSAVGNAWAAITAIAVAVLAIATFAVYLAVPRIAAFAVPPMAMTGTTVQAEYSASGAGRLAYLVTAPDGHRVAGGVLADRAGAIPIAIPAAADNGAYTLQLTMQGPLGTAKELRVLNGVVPKVRGAGGAAISDISVKPVVAKPGQTITVAYAASGNDGYVRLTGTDGAVWAQKAFSPGGKVDFVVPSVVDSREMRVLLHVTKGRSAAESSAGFLVAGAAASASKPAANAALAPPPDDANGTFAVAQRTIAGGNPIYVKILSPRNGMRIALTDTQSREVTGVDVGADQETVSLRAPNVTLATRYTVVASFTDGFGQESIVQPVTITPK